MQNMIGEGMNTARVDKAYMELVREFPLVPLREKSEFDEAIKVMARLAYRRTSLSNGYKSNLSAFLSGHRGLSKRAACRLAEYFKVSPALFLPKE
jgi:hypothetical protein